MPKYPDEDDDECAVLAKVGKMLYTMHQNRFQS